MRPVQNFFLHPATRVNRRVILRRDNLDFLKPRGPRLNRGLIRCFFRGWPRVLLELFIFLAFSFARKSRRITILYLYFFFFISE